MNAQDLLEAKEDMYEFICNVSKDVQGFKHRLDISTLTLVQLLVISDEWRAKATYLEYHLTLGG